MPDERESNESQTRELRLFLEEICCNLCRLEHASNGGIAPGDIKVSQEAYLGVPGLFGDIRVQVPGSRPYFIEVKYGYPPQQIINHLSRKYGPQVPAAAAAEKVILMLDAEGQTNWEQMRRELAPRVRPGLGLEVWDEAHLLAQIDRRLGLRLAAISEANFPELRQALDDAKGQQAFGEAWTNEALQSSLLWHFGFWRLKQLREWLHLPARSIMAPGMYPAVVAVMADLCSYSSFVRDTRDDDVVRHCLTSFYSKARYQILNTGGMLYQFVGDEVVGLYGLPDRQPGYFAAALECAEALVEIGKSVALEWQRHLDRIQTAQGVHIGMALGDVQVVSFQPFSRARVGAVSDALNLASRLKGEAGPSEIVVSNALLRKFDDPAQAQFQEIPPIEARNLGAIRAWKKRLACE